MGFRVYGCAYHFSAKRPVCVWEATSSTVFSKTGTDFRSFLSCQPVGPAQNPVAGLFCAVFAHGNICHRQYPEHENLLYIVAAVLLIGWAIGVFAYSLSGLVHIALIIAVIAIVLSLVRGGKANV